MVLTSVALVGFAAAGISFAGSGVGGAGVPAGAGVVAGSGVGAAVVSTLASVDGSGFSVFKTTLLARQLLVTTR